MVEASPKLKIGKITHNQTLMLDLMWNVPRYKRLRFLHGLSKAAKAFVFRYWKLVSKEFPDCSDFRWLLETDAGKPLGEKNFSI
jgi:hypothetical protein